MKAAFFVLISFFSVWTFADYTGDLFQQGSEKQKKIYTFEMHSSEADGQLNTHGIYKDLEGNIVVEEKATLQGSEIVRYEIDQKQVDQQGLIEVKEDKIFFTKTADGKTKTTDEKLRKPLVSSANFQKFVKDNWQALSKGDEVSFRYAVWDRQETVGFELFKTGMGKSGDEDVIVLKMKPSSFIIAALVKPIIFKFAADGSKLLEMNGRVPPKKKDGSTFKDLDAEVVYSYKEEAPAGKKTKK